MRDDLQRSTFNLQRSTLLVTAAEMRAIEAAEAELGNTSEVLMERAGRQVAEHARSWMGSVQAPRPLVLAGPGNNGGDALVVARLFSEYGWPVRCLTWTRTADRDQRLQRPLLDRGVPVAPLSAASSAPTPIDTSQLESQLEWCTLIIDGLLGTGITRDVDGDLAQIVRLTAASSRPVVAVDIPTGVDSDTGAVRGVALTAALTVALGLLKYGHVQQPGARLSGQITLGDIGLSDQNSREMASGRLLDDATVRAMLPERPLDSNKGTFGKAMVVAGSVNYIGAGVLATQGAMRSGAGLVTLACAGDLLALMAAKLTECTFLPLPSDLGSIAGRGVDKLRESLDGYDALLVGCGLGKERETAEFLKGLVSPHAAVVEQAMGFGARISPAKPGEEKEMSHLPPLVLDGDALNILSEWEGWQAAVPEGSILTPHPGEMGRLLGSSVEDVQKDRVGAARAAAADWKQIVVLKGAGTVIADPSGRVYVSSFSNPALATAGTGDVLAGAIVGFLAQGLSAVDAACAGVYLHGLAGELLREQYGVAGGLAGDLPVLLARAQRRLREV